LTNPFANLINMLIRSVAYFPRVGQIDGKAAAVRFFATSSSDGKTGATVKPTLVTGEEGVHQTMHLSKTWRNKPLFRRQGDVRFKTGLEAANLLVGEAKRRDSHESSFISSVKSIMTCLAPVFDRNPRYAFLAKQLQEPERFIQFRVAWIDDTGVVRMNRGYRIQYSSSMGPYEGSLNFGGHINAGVIKSLGFDTVFSNAITGFHIGGAVGGADINPFDKSEAEIQRFCQSYMTELFKYVGPDVDHPTIGMGVGAAEVGYLYGQYKRINIKAGSCGKPFLYGGDPGFQVRVRSNCCNIKIFFVPSLLLVFITTSNYFFYSCIWDFLFEFIEFCTILGCWKWDCALCT
jgi:hypothetical protein